MPAIDVRAQRLGQRVMARHDVLLAAFLEQPHGPAGAARPEVLNPHLQGCVDAREAVGQGGDQRTIAKVAQRRGRNGGEELARFGALEHRRLAGLDHVLWPARDSSLAR
jgi:hypothetical protein